MERHGSELEPSFSDGVKGLLCGWLVSSGEEGQLLIAQSDLGNIVLACSKTLEEDSILLTTLLLSPSCR